MHDYLIRLLDEHEKGTKFANYMVCFVGRKEKKKKNADNEVVFFYFTNNLVSVMSK